MGKLSQISIPMCLQMGHPCLHFVNLSSFRTILEEKTIFSAGLKNPVISNINIRNCTSATSQSQRDIDQQHSFVCLFVVNDDDGDIDVDDDNDVDAIKTRQVLISFPRFNSQMPTSITSFDCFSQYELFYLYYANIWRICSWPLTK